MMNANDNTMTTTEQSSSSTPVANNTNNGKSVSYGEYVNSTKQQIQNVQSQFSASTATTTSNQSNSDNSNNNSNNNNSHQKIPLFEGLDNMHSTSATTAAAAAANTFSKSTTAKTASTAATASSSVSIHETESPFNTHTERFHRQFVNTTGQEEMIGQRVLNKTWIPKMKYRVGREFAKFFMYLLFPFAVMLITSQPAIQEYLIMRGNYKNIIKSTEEMRTMGDFYDEDQGEDNTFFDLQEKNQRRVERFLNLQNTNHKNNKEQ